MSGICSGRVAVVTGAGRGIGRAYALEFARQGARVVVNDLGGDPTGSGSSTSPADEVVAEIRAAGGEAVADFSDVADFDASKQLVNRAVDQFGRLDVLVNNAGILRDRSIVNMTIEEWDSVIRVHLRGTFATTHWAAIHWRERAKASGAGVNGRLINTSSSSGLYSNPGQGNYAAAKAGIASFTVVAARELARYGVTANAIYPTAHSRLTEGFLPDTGGRGLDPYDPANFAPAVVWLGSERSAGVTGRVFGLIGSRIVLAEGWRVGPVAESDTGFGVEDLDAVMAKLNADAAPNTWIDGTPEKPGQFGG